MRLARFGNWSTGIVLEGDAMLDVSASVQLPGLQRSRALQKLRPYFAGAAVDWAPMIAAWDTVGADLQELVDAAQSDPSDLVTHRLDQIALLPPLPSPHARVFAMAANFADHAARALSVIRQSTITEDDVLAQAKEALPSGFLVLPDTVIGHDGTVVPPVGHRLLDYEVEAAVVLRRQGDDVTFWGYTAWNDLSVRDKYFPGGPAIDVGPLVWALQKNFATGNAAGPWLVVEDFDEADLSLQTWVNGDQRQDGSTADMIYTFRETVEHLGNYLGLQSGDVLLSGTPAGTAVEDGLDGDYLAPGDMVEIQVGATPVLRTMVGDF